MHANCPKSCGTCARVARKASPVTQKMNAEQIMATSERFGVRQLASGGEAADTLKVIKESIDYMASDEVQNLPGEYRDECRNKHKLCSFWAVTGTLNRCFLLLAYEAGLINSDLFGPFQANVRTIKLG